MRKVVLLLAALAVGISCALGQQRTVTGVVTSVEDGAPLIQLAVQVKGTTTGAVTDANGRYSIRVAGPESVLVFSYTGFDTQEITVGEQETINVVMQLANEEIDEVMVVAFGKAKKSTFTGSAASVSGKELERKQVSNVLNALSGKVPGVTVTSSNNQPGSSSTIRIRGNGSFNANSNPLYVVDGMPYEGDVSAINPADVESTVLLKDAASAALYGARAANGVVMITTKNGANARHGGVMNVNVTAKVGYNFRGIPDYDKITDPKQYAAKYYEAIWNQQKYRVKGNKDKDDEDITQAADAEFSNPKKGIVYFPFSRAEGSTNPWFTRTNDGHWEMDKSATIGTTVKDKEGNEYWMQPDDWNEEAFEANMRQEYTVSLSGRTDKANYFFSSGYLNDKGYTVRSNFERFTTRLRGDFKPKTWLNLGANLSYTGYKTNSLDATTTQSSGSSGNIFAMTNFAAPIYPIYVRDKNKQILKNKWGKPVYDFGTGQFPGLIRPYLSLANPLAANTYDIYDNVAAIIGMRSNADFIMPYGFRFSIIGGYDLDDSYQTATRNPYYGQFASIGGIIDKSFDRYTTLNLQQLLTWNQAYGENHIDVLLGHEYYDRDVQYLSGSKEGMFHPDSRELDQAIRQPSTSSSRSRYRVEGFLGRAQYDFAEKYFLTLSFRRDGSSRFSENRRWGNFGSVGASWMLSNESFMESTRSFLDLLKVKASYGIQGNDNIEVNFAYLDRFKLTNNNGAYATTFYYKGNDITWETSHNLNFGVEFAFFRHRLSGNIELYRREVSDMLFKLTMPGSSGYRYVWDNVGAMSNTGMEFEITGVPYQDKNIRWSVTLNGGMIKNKLEKLPAEWKQSEYGYVEGSIIYKEGGSLYDYFIPKYKGVNEQGEALWQTYDKKTGQYGVTTDYSVASKNENRVEMKDLSSIINGGISTSVDFWDFDFSAGFTYTLGGKRFDGAYQDLMQNGNRNGAAMHKDLLNSWTPQNTNTNVPRMDASSNAKFNETSDRFLTSRSFFAIDNLTLGYTLPKSWVDKINVGSLRVYVVADNVWLFSARKGFDPRFTTTSGVGYKAIRSISGGLNLTF